MYSSEPDTLKLVRLYYFKNMCELKKVCKACLEEKVLSEFNIDRKANGGYKSKCKICIKNKVPIEKLKITEVGITKTCRACLEVKDLSYFGINVGYKDGFQAKCKTCISLDAPINEKAYLTGEVKVCKVCLEPKDLYYFHKRSDRSYSHESRCIQCTRDGRLIDKKIFIRDTKKCSECGEYKKFSNYQKCNSCINGVTSHCKKCNVSRSKKYRDSLPKDVVKKRKREEYDKNRDKYILRARKWVENNRDRHNESIRERTKIRLKEDPLYKLKVNISSLIRTTFILNLDGNYRKVSKTLDIIGCSVDKFRSHLESQFENWMSWENYGMCETSEYRCTWHLDHIVPISLAKTEEEIYLLNHWSNFQPMCFLKNTKDKSNNIYPLTNLELNITITEDKQIIHND